MAQMNFGGVIENVMTREEFPLEKAREVLKHKPDFGGNRFAYLSAILLPQAPQLLPL